VVINSGAGAVSKTNRILVVDDEQTNIQLLDNLLRAAGYSEITTTTDAEAVVELHRDHRYDLILLDLKMPKRSGFEILADLAAAEGRASVPVLVVTAQADRESRLRALELGARDFVTKPFDRVELLRRIQNLIEVQDLSRSVQARNRELEQKAEQIRAMNKELEAFSYAVAHDLRAPLRRMQGFCDLLIEGHRTNLGGEALKLLDRIDAQGKNMTVMIDSLLELSRVTQTQLRRRVVSLSGLAESIAVELKESEPSRKAEFVIEPNVDVDADENFLRVALTNLIGNAWKYSSRNPSSRIEFGVSRQGDAAEFFVRDNGAGLDMAFASRLFTPFQRFHAQGEFPGVGVGLATVQRIIHRHGGHIRCESTPGQGATFFFTVATGQDGD
jgi:two-component system, sensor histidine kinase and response regulator